MSNEFRGYLISQGFSSLKLETCDVCKKNQPAWIETRGLVDIAEIRVTCEKCHEDFLSTVDQMEIQSKIEDFSLYDEKPVENKDITTTERPEWMNKFIDDQKDSGSLDSISGDSVSKNEDEITMEKELILDNTNIYASWSANFVKEALFGADPQSWLESQGGFQEDQIKLTLATLSNFSTNNIGSVKISAILCLYRITTKFADRKEEVLNILQIYSEDIEDTVQNYAKEMIDKLK